MTLESLITDYLRQIRSVQRTHRAAGDTAGAVAAYDQLIGEMLIKFGKATELEREGIRSAMTREGSGFLLGAAEGAATWAIRENDGSRIRIGLASLLIENLKEDYRETLIGLTLLHNTSRRLATDLKQCYADVRHLGTSEGIALFDSYFDAGGKTLDEMGYHETVNKDGDFCYSRGW